MKVEWGIRVMKYEDKIMEQSKERLTRLCWEKQRLENNRQNVINLKESFLNKVGLSSLELDIIRDLGKDAKEEVRKQANGIENQVICSKIREARYNQNYKDYIDICEIDRLPKYLWKRYGNVDIKSIATIRCGNVERANKYWLAEKTRECILCSKDLCTWKYLLYDCEKTKEYVNGIVVENIDVVKEIKGDIKNFELLKALKR